MFDNGLVWLRWERALGSDAVYGVATTKSSILDKGAGALVTDVQKFLDLPLHKNHEVCNQPKYFSQRCLLKLQVTYLYVFKIQEMF